MVLQIYSDVRKKTVRKCLGLFSFFGSRSRTIPCHKSFSLSSTKFKNGTGASHFLMDKSLRLNYYEHCRTNFLRPKFAPGHLDEGNKRKTLNLWTLKFLFGNLLMDKNEFR